MGLGFILIFGTIAGETVILTESLATQPLASVAVTT